VCSSDLGTESEIPCDLALLAIGFLHPEKRELFQSIGLEFDKRGNIKAEDYQTKVQNVFVAGDAHKGQSLVVWAISEGRECARAVDTYLMGSTVLPSRDHSLVELA
jgi:glutamate synthase (NADPH) small chain